jgi:transcriptional regulator with XRE-family HTH domain
MIIGDRLRVLREQRHMSQGDIEKRTGLLRCYLSRVENGHTVPAIETLEKLARALEMPLYQLLYDGDQPPRSEVPAAWKERESEGWGSSGRDYRYMRKLQTLLGKMKEADRQLILHTLQQMVRRQKPHAKPAPAASAPQAAAAAAGGAS